MPLNIDDTCHHQMQNTVSTKGSSGFKKKLKINQRE